MYSLLTMHFWDRGVKVALLDCDGTEVADLAIGKVLGAAQVALERNGSVRILNAICKVHQLKLVTITRHFVEDHRSGNYLEYQAWLEKKA